MWDHLKEKGVKLPAISAEEISRQVEPVLRVMEKSGIMLDVKEFKKLENKLNKKVKDLEQEIYELAGGEFNISSPVQMQEVLFEKLKLPTADLKRNKSGVSTAASELKKIEFEHDIIKPILEYRELSKLLSTYLKPLPELVGEDGRLHTSYGQDTGTSRITSSNPNLQNIPIKGKYGPEIRKAFVAEKGKKLVVADYSQIELRVVACLADDKVMIEAFSKGEDIHSKTASELFGIDIKDVNRAHRSLAKTVNFGVLYGMSPYGLSQALSIDQKAAAEYIDKYFSVHSGIKAYVEKMKNMAKKEGYVETLFGYRRVLPNINSHNRYISEAEERMAINTPVQGTAAEILKIAMIELDKKLNITTTEKFHPTSLDELRGAGRKGTEKNNLAMKQLSNEAKAELLLTVHDELVVEAPEEISEEIANIVRETMENVVKLCVPIEVEVGVGKNWAEGK